MLSSEAEPRVSRGRPGPPSPPAGASTASRPAGPRSLAPKEHGAYGQLGLPLVAALAMGRPSLAAAGLTAAALAAFLAHEPALLLTGQRGTRALREDGGRARRRLALLGAVTALGGAGGLWLAPQAARLAALAPLGLAVLLAPFVLRGAEKTAPGELLAAATLAAAALPVALAAGVAPALAWSAWAAWCMAFAASTLAVRAVIAHARNPRGLASRLAAPLTACAVAAALAGGGVLLPAAALGAAPMLLLALAVAARPPSPRSLKRVGWSLVAASFALAGSLAIGAHL